MSPATASPVIYIACDVPEGMTLREWRRRREPLPRAGLVAAIRRACGLR